MNSKNTIHRIFVEKKPGFDVEARKLYADLRDGLGIESLESIRIINMYDVEGLTSEEFTTTQDIIFSEPPVDNYYLEEVPLDNENNGNSKSSRNEKDEKDKRDQKERVIITELLPGLYDQRADSASQCIQILTQGEKPLVQTARLIVLKGTVSDADFNRIKEYCMNPLESREASLDKPLSLALETTPPENIHTVEGFIKMSQDELETLFNELGLAMSLEDLAFCREYFAQTERRDPTITEIRLIDTYWSDHCRHTTFSTTLQNVQFEEGPYAQVIEEAYQNYLNSRQFVYEGKDKDICLMDLAIIAMKELRKRGKLDDQEISAENNACSIIVPVDINGQKEEWLVMFKNETHNHPTEIEPYGGAATCLGGAIRDPLSGRAYVYQAMRVTGSGDPRKPIAETLPGKLPQKKITTGAAAGYSSYGNQIGLATGQVAEVYDENFVAKRMEVGAVIGAAPRKNIKREEPSPGDVILLIGGRTGRDGCGGATGSSKEHTEESLFTCSAEVQKGNPPTERKIQRLFRDPQVTGMIKRCNDFGAGGVSVAIGELADGLEIFLDKVPKKYDGLDGTELAISESQERMAVVVTKEDEAKFREKAQAENLECTTVACVTAEGRLRMYWRDKPIVDISRDFLNTNGVKQRINVTISAPDEKASYFHKLPEEIAPNLNNDNLTNAWLTNLSRLNVCSQKGLVEMFDSSIGAGTVLMPFGGKYQDSPQEGMAAKIPVLRGETTTGTLMSFGYNPKIGSWSPFHGALFAVIEACAKITAMGGNCRKIRLSLQEYFEKLGKDPVKWGKPCAALLGAYTAQMKLGIPAIGGKDSMSGTFKDLTVPPTLVAFAVNLIEVKNVISTEFKKIGSKVVLLPLKIDENDLPDFEELDRNYTRVHELAGKGKILAAHSVRDGGIAEAISKMCFGNRIGFNFNPLDKEKLFVPLYGSLILEVEQDGTQDGTPLSLFQGLNFTVLGTTQEEAVINVDGTTISLETALKYWQSPLEKVFPTQIKVSECQKPRDAIKENKINNIATVKYTNAVSNNVKNNVTNLNNVNNVDRVDKVETTTTKKAKVSFAKPRVLIPVFPGTNCEYDTERAVIKAGGVVETMIIKNLSPQAINESIKEMAQKIANSQIIIFPGGFSAGDEPDGSGKFIAATFRNPLIKNAVNELLQNRDGLVLGICNGFQALIKLGLVPYGEIRDMDDTCPTLTFNTIGRHISKMVHTKITSKLSPWLYNVELGDIHTIPVSHGEGRFVAKEAMLKTLFAKGQVATQYVDLEGKASYDLNFNPNGSVEAIEGITSPDGRVFGKMGHSERIGSYVAKNVPGNKDQKLFQAGVNYFK